jgi:integrase/recombinase XerC/integrase/recombinase XerD
MRRKPQRFCIKPQQLSVLAPEDQAAFSSALEQHASNRERAVMLLLFHHGLQAREIAMLNWEDVTLTAHTGRLRLSSRGAGHDMHLDALTRRALTAWLIERESFLNKEAPALFLSSRGERLSPAGMEHIVRRFGWQIGLNVTVSMLRNTCLANLASQGTQIWEVARRAGHKDLRSTMRFFASGT